jgi:hypothetical protein
MPRVLDGTTWLEISVSAARHRLRVGTVRQAITDGRVHSHTLDGRTWVCDDDVADVELAWYRRGAVLAQPEHG